MPFEIHSASDRWKTDRALWAKLRDAARKMRSAPTPAEAELWEALRRGIHGHRFRRQHAIGRFIVDFYCSKAWLVVEVDGPVHETSADQDADRDALLRMTGLRVIRFTNDRVLIDLEGAIREIAIAIETPASPSPPGGEGDRGGEVRPNHANLTVADELFTRHVESNVETTSATALNEGVR